MCCKQFGDLHCVVCSLFLEQLGITPVTACKTRVLSNRPYRLTGVGNISGLFCFSNSTNCHALATILFLWLYSYELSMVETKDQKNVWLKVVLFIQEWEKKSTEFSTFKKAQEMREECKGLNLGSLLITPVQRVPRYFWLRFTVILG